MRRLTFCVMFALLATGAAAQDLAKSAEREYFGDLLVLDSRTALTGTWTCTTSSLTCTGVAGGATEAAQTELDDADVVELCGYRYAVDGEPPSQSSIKIKPHRVQATGNLRPGADAACTAQAAYKANLGLSATEYTVKDGSGTSSAFGVSTDTVTALALEVGGGYGAAGCTCSTAGVLQCNGAPQFDGQLVLGVDAATNTAGSIKLWSAGAVDFYTTITAGVQSETSAYVWPTARGAASSVLTDAAGNGTLSWAAIPADGDSVTGNEVTNATDGTLTRGGSGTAVSPYTLGINLSSGNTWLAALGISLDGNNAEAAPLVLTNSNVPTTGQTGDTAVARFRLVGSVNTVEAAHEAARLEAFKISDWFHASDETDHDSGLNVYTTVNGTETLRATFWDGTYGFKVVGSIYSSTTILGTAFQNLTGVALMGTYGFESTSVAAGTDANSLTFNYNGLQDEGATGSADTDEGLCARPQYSDAATATALDDGDVSGQFATYVLPTADAEAQVGTTIGHAPTSGKWHFTHDDWATATGATHAQGIVTLPAKAVLMAADVVITEQAVFDDTLTIACGSAAAAYNQITTAQTLKAAANTVYGDADAERGTDLPDADMVGFKLYSYTATQAITCLIDGNATHLDDGHATAGEFDVVLTWMVLP